MLNKNSFDSGFRSLGPSAIPDNMRFSHGEPYVAFASCAIGGDFIFHYHSFLIVHVHSQFESPVA